MIVAGFPRASNLGFCQAFGSLRFGPITVVLVDLLTKAGPKS